MNSERISPFWVNGYQPFSAIILVKNVKYYNLDYEENISLLFM